MVGHVLVAADEAHVEQCVHKEMREVDGMCGPHAPSQVIYFERTDDGIWADIDLHATMNRAMRAHAMPILHFTRMESDPKVRSRYASTRLSTRFKRKCSQALAQAIYAAPWAQCHPHSSTLLLPRRPGIARARARRAVAIDLARRPFSGALLHKTELIILTHRPQLLSYNKRP